MKKVELDLSKAHVDQYKPAEDKSYDGLKLAYTKAGWATVTKDGTIVEVLDAFPGEKSSVVEDFDSRDELPSGSVIDESILLNPRDIGSEGVDDDSEVFDPTPNAALQLPTITITNTTSVTGLAGDGTSAATGSYSEAAGDLAFTATAGASDGYQPYSFSWTADLNGSGPVSLGISTESASLTLSEIESALNDVLADTDSLVIEATVTDSNSPTAGSVTASFTISVTA